MTDTRWESTETKRKSVASISVNYLTQEGVTLPDIVTLCNVADYFGISLEELFGREKSDFCMSDKYTEEQIRGFEAGLQLLKCCNAARQYGLLAMEETAIKEQMDEFLVFGVQFILSGMRKGQAESFWKNC